MDWDTIIFYSINGLAGQWEWLDAFMRLASRPSTYFLPGLLGLIYWYRRQERKAVLHMIVLAALIPAVDAAGSGVKQMIERPRPCRVLPDVRKVTGCGQAFAFPSNHAVNTAAAGMFFHLMYPATAIFVWPLVAFIGFSRVYVGAHYATDVLGGWLLGGLGAAIVVLLLGKTLHRN